MSGIDVARLITADHKIAATPLIMLTSYDDRNEMKAAKDVDIRALLTKPVRKQMLRKAIIKAVAPKPSVPVAVGGQVERPKPPKTPILQPGGTMLLVEDNEMNHDMLSRRLTRRGFQVVIAVDGVQGVAVSGKYAYLANGTDGLRIYDISNPTNLVAIGHTNNGGSAYSVVLSGNYAYLANGSDGLRIYDVSNPTAPINVGHANDGGLAQGLAVSGSYVYLANGADGLRIYALEPQLSIGLTRTNTLLFSWPSSLAGFNLQQNPDLKPANWLVVTNAPTTLGGQNQIITPLPGRSAFYRLYSP